MREELIELEKDFSNNDYFGTNVWTEEKYRVLSGNVPILISSPHSVNQIRNDDVRDAEKYTGALARFLNMTTNSFCIYELFTHSDPNLEENHLYKMAVVNLIRNYRIKLLIDIHSSTFIDNADIDIVTNKHQTLCGNDNLIDKIKVLGIKYNVTIGERNEPNKEKENEIIYISSNNCNIPSIRIVINNKLLDMENYNRKLEDVCKLIEDFVSYFNYS